MRDFFSLFPFLTLTHDSDSRPLHYKSSLEAFACLRDLRRQCSQPLLSVRFKDITVPLLPWRNVYYRLVIAGDALGSHTPWPLFKLVEAKPGPNCADAVEDGEGRKP